MTTPPPTSPARRLTGPFDPSHQPAPLRELVDGDFAAAPSGHGLLVPVNHGDLIASAQRGPLGWLARERALNALDFP